MSRGCREQGRTPVSERLPPNWEIGDVSAWWPLEHLLALSRCNARTDAELLAALGIRPPHPDFLALMVHHGCEQGRALALGILNGLAEGDETTATATLKDLLCQPCGPDSVRRDIHSWLLKQDHPAPGEAVELYVQSSLRTVRPTKIEIHSETTPDTELSPEDADEYARAFDLVADGRTADALAAFESLHRTYPHSARLMTELANVKRALKLPMEVIEALVRKAWDTDQSYLFARTAMACLLAQKSDAVAARELLEPLTKGERFHYSEWRSYLGAQLAIAQADGNTTTILTLAGQLADLEQRF